jgi:hypothetical protein
MQGGAVGDWGPTADDLARRPVPRVWPEQGEEGSKARVGRSSVGFATGLLLSALQGVIVHASPGCASVFLWSR